MLETIIDEKFIQQSEEGSTSQFVPNAECAQQMMTYFEIEVFPLFQLDLPATLVEFTEELVLKDIEKKEEVLKVAFLSPPLEVVLYAPIHDGYVI